jgi:N-acetyltransferase
MLEILSMVDTVLSAPPLPTSILKLCKVILFVTSVGTHPERDRIAGVCVSQKIRWAMKVIEKEENDHEVSEAVECE